MCHLSLRLIVAVVTFVAGLAASALWGMFFSTTVSQPAKPILAVPAPPTYTYVAPPPVQESSAVVSGGILNGRAVSKPVPAYPPIARAAGAQGTVVVRIMVDEDGRVINAEPISGHPLLQSAATNAALQARFQPTRLSGKPVKVAGLIHYNFTLE